MATAREQAGVGAPVVPAYRQEIASVADMAHSVLYPSSAAAQGVHRAGDGGRFRWEYRGGTMADAIGAWSQRQTAAGSCPGRRAPRNPDLQDIGIAARDASRPHF